MGIRGPIGASKQTLKLRNDQRHRHQSDTLELPVDKPNCPAWLDPTGKSMWRLVTAELEAAGAIARVDLAVVTIHCQSWGEYVALTAKLTRLEATPDADVKAVWHLRNSRDRAAESVRLTAQQLGLTPASRPRIKVSDRRAGLSADDIDPLEAHCRRAEGIE